MTLELFLMEIILPITAQIFRKLWDWKIYETASLLAIVCTFKVQSRAFISKEHCICTSISVITCIITQ